MTKYDLIVVGGGACGIASALSGAYNNKKVLLIEKLPNLATKLKASGGGRCNLTNTLQNDEFIKKFDKNARFIQDVIKEFDHKKLIDFFKNIGVETHAPDGFRVFPTSHSSLTIVNALKNELSKQNVKVLTSTKVVDILQQNNQIIGVKTLCENFFSNHIVFATGGLGYPTMGSNGDGHKILQQHNHTLTKLYPAMMPLKVKESWVEFCKADTIPKVTMRVDIKKYKKLTAKGDLIFTKNGIRGPVVLDFAREITPLFEKYDEVPILVNLTKGLDEDKIIQHFKNETKAKNILELLQTLLPKSVAVEMLKLLNISQTTTLKKLDGSLKQQLIKILAWTPLHVTGHDGFKMAMVTRGGVSLKNIDPKTMQSKLIKGLYFCGELVDIDGPCGGYNLQWAFASGYIAGKGKLC